MTDFQPQFEPTELRNLAGRYDYADDGPALEIGRRAQTRGYFKRDELIEVCRWKSPRPAPRVRLNKPEVIEEATRIALSAATEEFRIQAPQVLQGVSWPTASVILHIAHADRYPILDYRALEALGISPAPAYSMSFWLEYVQATRALADGSGVDMRTLDRALWRWSRERSDNDRRTRKGSPQRASLKPVHSPVERHSVVPDDIDAIILGCVSSKHRGRDRAKDLYVSPLWKKRRTYAETSGSPWVIFSAKHGILDPDQEIEWYDVALAKLRRTEREVKGTEAAAQLVSRFGDLNGKAFEIHAGSAYVNALRPPLEALGAELFSPLEGLSIGHQLHWYLARGRR